MKNILVTGGNGQLGQELQRLAKGSEHTFLFTDVAELDITDLSAVERYFAEKKINVCINCAAYTAVDKAETDEATAIRINVTGAENLGKACATQGAVLFHISTDFVFDGASGKLYTETDAPNPLGVYGATKLKGEQKALAANPKTYVVRTAWLYSSFANNFVKTMLRLGEERKELGIVADQVGTPTYAADLAKALLQMLEKEPGPAAFGVYHYSNEGVASWYDFAVAIFEMGGLQVKVNPIPTEAYPVPAKRPSYSVLDKRKIKESFGLSVPHWRNSLKQCLAELQSQ